MAIVQKYYILGGYYVKKFLALIVVISVLICSLGVPVSAKENPKENMTTLDMINSGKTNFSVGDTVITITDSTREKYLESSGEEPVIPKAYDEVVKYKTLTSTSSIGGSSISTVIGVEITYLYSNVTRKAVQILGVGNPYIRIAGPITEAQWDGAEPNTTWSSTNVRISYTGSAFVGVTESVGTTLGEIWTFSYEASATQYFWSDVVTQVANFYLSQLY